MKASIQIDPAPLAFQPIYVTLKVESDEELRVLVELGRANVRFPNMMCTALGEPWRAAAVSLCNALHGRLEPVVQS